MSSKFKGVLTKAEAIAEEVKADVAKAASDVDGAVQKVAADAPEIEALADVVVPGASKFVPLGLTVLEDFAGVLDAGDTAAEQNLLNAGFDSAVIAQVKAAIADIKKLA
jgi:hypothetical protein